MSACTRCSKLTGAAAPSAPATTRALIVYIFVHHPAEQPQQQTRFQNAKTFRRKWDHSYLSTLSVYHRKGLDWARSICIENYGLFRVRFQGCKSGFGIGSSRTLIVLILGFIHKLQQPNFPILTMQSSHSKKQGLRMQKPFAENNTVQIFLQSWP